MTELVLGIDRGTASSKAVLACSDGAVIAEAERPSAEAAIRAAGERV